MIPTTAVASSVVDRRSMNRFELSARGDTAFLVYTRTTDALVLIHTEVPTVLGGRRVGEALVEAALQSAHAEHLRIVAVCPFVRAYLRRRLMSP